MEKSRKENEKLNEKLLIDEENDDNSFFEVPKDALEKLERKTMYDLEELKKYKEKNAL